AEEPEGERHDLGELGDQLEQADVDPDRPTTEVEELLDVAATELFKPKNLRRDHRRERDRERRVQIGRRRAQQRNELGLALRRRLAETDRSEARQQPHPVRQDHEKEYRPDDREELAALANSRHALAEAEDRLGRVLDEVL